MSEALCAAATLDDDFKKLDDEYNARLELARAQGKRYAEAFVIAEEELAVARDNALAQARKEHVGHFDASEEPRCLAKFNECRTKVAAFRALQRILVLASVTQVQKTFDNMLLSSNWMHSADPACPAEFESHAFVAQQAQVLLDSGLVMPSKEAVLSAICANNVKHLHVLLADPRTKSRVIQKTSANVFLNSAVSYKSSAVVEELLRLSQSSEWEWLCDSNIISTAFVKVCNLGHLQDKETFNAFLWNDDVREALTLETLDSALVNSITMGCLFQVEGILKHCTVLRRAESSAVHAKQIRVMQGMPLRRDSDIVQAFFRHFSSYSHLEYLKDEITKTFRW